MFLFSEHPLIAFPDQHLQNTSLAGYVSCFISAMSWYVHDYFDASNIFSLSYFLDKTDYM